MPVDASIYQNFNRPTVALLDPFEIQARKLQIRNALAQGTLQDQQTQMGALDLQARQRSFANDQSASMLFNPAPANALAPQAAPLPGTMNTQPGFAGQPLPSAPPMASAAPASAPQSGPPEVTDTQIMNAFKGEPTRALTIIHARNAANAEGAKYKETLADTAQKKTNILGSVAAGLDAVGYAPVSVQHAVALLQSNGLNAEAQQVSQAYQQGGPGALKALAQQAIAASPEQQKTLSETVTAGAHKLTADSTAAKDKAMLPGIQSENTIKAQTAAGTAPIQPAQQAQLTQQKIRDAQVKANEDARIGIERGNSQVARAAADPWGALGLNAHPMGGGAGSDLHGAEFLKTLPPQMAATVKAVAEGRQTNLPRGGKELDQLMGATNQYDPTYSVQRAQTRTAFQTGAQGKNIGNLNTAVVHLDQYHEVMKAMHNGTFQPGNQLYNWAAEKFGSAAVTNPAFIRQSLAGEAANALKGNATDPEIAGIMKTLGENQSDAQQEGTALAGLHILRAKLNTYDEQYHQVNADDPWSPVLPSAGKVFARYGMPVGNSVGAAPAAASAHAVGDTVMYNGAAHKVAAIKPNGKLVLEGN